MIISAAKAHEAAEVLGVELTGLTPRALGQAYRSKAKDCHPDHHGSTQLGLWARVSWAKECLERWVAAHPKDPPVEAAVALRGGCRACDGTGRVTVPQAKRFGPPLTMSCVICRGLGTVIPDEDDHD
jgi:DnaJ-class molecular chaperone